MPGILPYINFNPMTGLEGKDETYVMISQERGGAAKGQWDFFNGRQDPGETLEEAAVREGYEESVGLFGTEQQIADKKQNLHKSQSAFLLNALDLKTKDQILKECTQENYLKRKKFAKYQKSCFQEKTEVRWVKLSSLIDSCTKNVFQKDKVILEDFDGKKLEIRAPLVHLVKKNQAQLEKLIKTPAHAKRPIENPQAIVKPLKDKAVVVNPKAVAKPLQNKAVVNPKAVNYPVKVEKQPLDQAKLDMIHNLIEQQIELMRIRKKLMSQLNALEKNLSLLDKALDKNLTK